SPCSLLRTISTSSPGFSSACGAASGSSITRRRGCARTAHASRCRSASRRSWTRRVAPSVPRRSPMTSPRASRPSSSWRTGRCTTPSPICPTAPTSSSGCRKPRHGCGATPSIGVALSDPDYGQPQDLLRDADLAMYQAKEQGRARFQVFDVAMRDSAQARFGMEADLRNALERRELRLVFQPIVELQTGRVYGFEALLRWHRPKRGVILPPEFVPLAEQTGLIIPIGRWALQDACRQVRRWQDAFPTAGPVRASVNLSGKQLAHPGLVDDVRTAFQDAGLPPACLALEISESVLMESVESSTDVLHQLRELKVELHIDDFGTGHSSLSSLPRFPLHAIKIDRSFVHRMGSRRNDVEIVRSIVELAGNLGLGVIAEGVETVTQRARLIAFGCALGQGYLFSKPLEAKAAAVMLAGPEEPGRRIA